MPRLPRVAEIDGSSNGSGFFLCARKERRTGRSGPFLVLVLQDVSGAIDAKVFGDADSLSAEFDAGEFVAVQGKGNLFNGRLELIVDRIRRVIPSDAASGFREEDCIPASKRPLEEMWTELLERIASVQNRFAISSKAWWRAMVTAFASGPQRAKFTTPIGEACSSTS